MRPVLRQTKLERPRVLQSIVSRQRLWAMLDQGMERPLTLVCAGPGFGKTTLVSSWLEARAVPAAWLSLDEDDGDLTVFLNYLIAALQAVSGTQFPETLALLYSPQRRRSHLFTATLINELARLPSPTTLVLDDYSAFSSEAVDDFVADLVRNCPLPLHLILITRRNPPLPIPNLRAKDAVVEIRSRHLRFSHEEIRAYLEMALTTQCDEAFVQQLEQYSEGWIVGLKLAALSLRRAPNKDAALALIAANSSNILEYLTDEVYLRQPPPVQSFLVKTSILNHFNASLCRAVVGDGDPEWDASNCISLLIRADLLVVTLDDKSEWYRLHSLFREMLLRRLTATLSEDAINELHRRAAGWLAEQELMDDALHHAVRAHDLDLTAQLIGRALPAVLNREDRPTLEKWLALLPEADVMSRPELLMLRAWAFQFSWQLGAQGHALEQADALIHQTSADPGRAAELKALQTQAALIRAQQAFFANRPEQAVAMLTEAFPQMPEAWAYMRGGTVLYLGLSMQAVGEADAAVRLLKTQMERYGNKRDPHSLRIPLTLCFVYMAEGKLEQVRQAAHDLLRLTEGGSLVTLQSWAHYFLGRVHYQWNELDAAERHLSAILDNRYTAVAIAVREGLNCLAEVYQHRGKEAKALRIAELLGELDLDQLGHEDESTRALRARLLLLRGDVQAAARWAAAYDAPIPDRPLVWQYNPHTVQAQILLATGEEADLHSARRILDSLVAIAERTHSRRAKIELLAMRALAVHLGGEQGEAEATLRQAVEMARPGGFLRIFADQGQLMHDLLSRLAEQGVAVQQLLNVFPGLARPNGAAAAQAIAAQRARQSAAPASPAVEPLTAREREVLALLSSPLSNREIAVKLNVSYATVKRHTITIYGKLGVNSRWDAVARAADLGHLPTTG
jgi:LuxR family maltose regulon positive regulatory protein